MKKTFLISCLLILLLESTAQELIKFINSKGNYAYLGILNEFTYKSLNKNNLIFKSKTGIVTHTKGKLFFSSSIGDSTELSVYSMQGKDTIKQYQQKIIVRRIPNPTIVINSNLIEGYQDKSIFKNAIRLDGYCSPDIPLIKFFVTSFNLNIIKDNIRKSYTSSSSYLSSEMKYELSNIQKGNKLIFSNINLSGNDGSNRLLNKSIEVIIK